MKGEQRNPLSTSSASPLGNTEEYSLKFKCSEGITHLIEALALHRIWKEGRENDNETDEQLKRMFDICMLPQSDSAALPGSLGELSDGPCQRSHSEVLMEAAFEVQDVGASMEGITSGLQTGSCPGHLRYSLTQCLTVDLCTCFH